MSKHLPSDWKVVYPDSIVSGERSIVSGPFGSNIGKRFFVESGVPVIRGNNLTLGGKCFVDDGFVFLTEEKAKQFKNCQAVAGDLVFTAAGTLGQVGLIPKNSKFPVYIISNKQLRIRPDTHIAIPEYLYYWFSSREIRNYIIGLNTGSSVPLITLGKLRSVPIILPPLPVQHKIASILSAYDELIENNTRRIKILEEMAQSIYREWFVNFRFPEHEKVKMVDSPLGMIPEGWKVTQMSDVLQLCYGKGLKSENRREGNIPVYGSSGIVGYHEVALVEGPGIIVGRKGNVGTVYWSNSSFYPIDTDYFVKTELSLHYVYYNLLEQNFLNNDAAVPGLNRGQAYSLPFIRPDDSLMTAFTALVGNYFKLSLNLRNQKEVLRQTRDLLLPRLISGEIDVADLDIQVPEELFQ